MGITRGLGGFGLEKILGAHDADYPIGEQQAARSGAALLPRARLTATRSLPDHIRPLRRHEDEARRRNAGIAHEVRQLERGALTEVVKELHLGQHIALEAHANALER